ncbi:hypothetical protein ACFXA4_21060 [Streptomyces sp. NPDC059442]|uniref:hypothetical protein n=1 Tax=Streptomyces sp. NPDC059442 TaxID=3346830 RepID=UPI00367758ED
MARAEPSVEDGFAEARARCRSVFGKAPAQWSARAKPRNAFLVDGDPPVEIGHTPAGDNRVSGDVTRYVTTTGS